MARELEGGRFIGNVPRNATVTSVAFDTDGCGNARVNVELRVLAR